MRVLEGHAPRYRRRLRRLAAVEPGIEPAGSLSAAPAQGQTITIIPGDADGTQPISISYEILIDGLLVAAGANPTYSGHLQGDAVQVRTIAVGPGGTGYLTTAAQIVGGGSVAAPVAAFVASLTSGSNPLSVTFTDQSTNSPTVWLWDFGDGGTASTQSPTHSYATAGTYTVSLTVTNVAGSDVEVKAGYITVNAPVGGGTATLTWLAPENEPGVDGYRVYWSQTIEGEDNSVTLAGVDTLTYTVTGLAAGRWYFKLRTLAGAVEGQDMPAGYKDIA